MHSLSEKNEQVTVWGAPLQELPVFFMVNRDRENSQTNEQHLERHSNNRQPLEVVTLPTKTKDIGSVAQMQRLNDEFVVIKT